MRKYGVALLFILACNVNAQLPYKYRVLLTDKQENVDLLNHPEVLLSERALARRAHHEVLVDTTDLPVSATYITRLAETGFPFVCASRWLNSVVVASSDSIAEESLRALPFVRDARLVWRDNQIQPSFFIKEELYHKQERKRQVEARRQLTLHQGDKLHEAGFKGEGMHIAVIDAGFLNVDKVIPLNLRVAGTRDFVNPGMDIFATHPHGTNVLSVMAAPDTEDFSGTAPNATYWLLRSEDASSEYPVEEDYWIAAAEYADSLGVDVINSSLGYSEFDDVAMNYGKEALDGKTAFITRGASIAASKGILVVNSAGNDGARAWRMISFPADSPDILTVGAITPEQQIADFSSHGFVRRDYVKPDVVGIGAPTYLIDDRGVLIKGSGTSFSTPAIAGLAACLWQALPELKNQEVIALMRKYGSLAQQPDSLRGYGIPDVYTAFSQTTNLRKQPYQQIQLVPLDTIAGIWSLIGLDDISAKGCMQLYNSAGQIAEHFDFVGNAPVFNLNHLEKGLYIMSVQMATIRFTQRIHLN